MKQVKKYYNLTANQYYRFIDKERMCNEKNKMPSVSKYPNWNLSLPNYVTLNFSRH